MRSAMQPSRRQALRDFIADFARIFTAYDIAFFGGKALQKRALRTVLGASAAIGSAYFGVRAGGDQALNILRESVILGIATYGAGYFIANLSEWRVSGNLNTARKSFLDLMSHYKKTLVEDHARHLWERVYSHEQLLGSHPPTQNTQCFRADQDALTRFFRSLPDDLQQRIGAVTESDQRELVALIQARDVGARGDIGNSFEEFLAAFLHGLQTPYHQSSQRGILGFDISLYEKWLEKDVFTEEDTLCGELIFNHVLGELDSTQSQMRKYLRRFSSSLRVPFWHTLTMRKLAVELGKEIKRLNLDTPEDVHAQHFLFPCDLADTLFRAEAGEAVFEQLQLARRRLMQKIFSNDRGTACRHVARMFRTDMRDALDRRLIVDAEFASGRACTGGHFEADFAAVMDQLWDQFGLDFDSARLERRRRRSAALAKECQQTLSQLGLALPTDPWASRSMTTAYLIDAKGLRAKLRAAARKGKNLEPTISLYQQLTTDQELLQRMSRLLRLARQLHAINDLHLNLYRHLVAQLGEHSPDRPQTTA